MVTDSLNCTCIRSMFVQGRIEVCPASVDTVTPFGSAPEIANCSRNLLLQFDPETLTSTAAGRTASIGKPASIAETEGSLLSKRRDSNGSVRRGTRSGLPHRRIDVGPRTPMVGMGDVRRH